MRNKQTKNVSYDEMKKCHKLAEWSSGSEEELEEED